MFLAFFFFFNDTATTEIYTLSLHDALPICDQHTADATVLPPEVVHPDPRHEHRAGILSLLREPCVELRSQCGEARGATLPEFRRIVGNREGRILGHDCQILSDDEPLDGAILGPVPEHVV